MQKAGRRMIAMVLSIFIFACAVASIAAITDASRSGAPTKPAQTPEPVNPVRISRSFYSPFAMDNGGVWYRGIGKRTEGLGQIERIASRLELTNGAVGDLIEITVKSNILDFSNGQMYLIIETQGMLHVQQLACTAQANEIRARFIVNYYLISEDAKVYIHTEGIRLGSEGRLEMDLQKCRRALNESGLLVGEYTIFKQGEGAFPLEKITGIDDMKDSDTVYVIFKDFDEVMRVIVQDGIVLGIAKLVDGEPTAFEYSFEKGKYVSVTDQSITLTSAEVQKTFADLGFSFMHAPDETAWEESMPLYSQHVALKLY